MRKHIQAAVSAITGSGSLSALAAEFSGLSAKYQAFVEAKAKEEQRLLDERQNLALDILEIDADIDGCRVQQQRAAKIKRNIDELFQLEK